MDPNNTTHLTCTTREAAEMLGISVRTAQIWVEEGRLVAWKTPGGHRRILRESVSRILEAQQRAGLRADLPVGILVLVKSQHERDAMKTMLLHQLPGCPVEFAEDGFSCLIKIGAQPPDVLITELAIPGVDMNAMLDSLGRNPRAQRMLVVVLLDSASEMQAARQRLPEDLVLVQRPLDSDELARMLRAFLPRRSRVLP